MATLPLGDNQPVAEVARLWTNEPVAEVARLWTNDDNMGTD